MPQVTEVRPLDISITKDAASLLFCSTLLIVIIMFVTRSYKKGVYESKKALWALWRCLS